MIAMFTDFGVDDMYVGQVSRVFAEQAPGVPVIDLLHTAPAFDVQAGAYLLRALQAQFLVGDVLLTVVDPGVGGPRAPLMVEADGKWFVGPDNGLLSRVIIGAREFSAHKILWHLEGVSDSFHGRDLFAPVAAMLATGVTPEHEPIDPELPDWPVDLERIIYIDHYGNAMTGISGDSVTTNDRVHLRGREIEYARVFSEARAGELFWYVNSIGLVEIAANQDSAANIMGLEIGDVCHLGAD
jgi:S-adenosylmethionine hydrolase